MTTNLSKGLLKRLCTQIGIAYTKELEQVVSAYHAEKCAESAPKEIARLKLKCNQLIGLCKSASGYLFDADLVDESNLILDAVPDIEQALEKIGEV